jgi:hypothetical protein
MLKRKSIILSVLVIGLLSCSRSTQIANAEEEIKENFRPGTSLVECKVLEIDPPRAIWFKRVPGDICKIEKEMIRMYENLYCEGKEYETIKAEPISKELPANAFSGSGNQFCQEAFVVYVYSPPCFQYTIGGRTYYIPRG